MKSKTNRFNRHPRKVLFVILVLLTLILDITLTGSYHLFKYGTIHKFAYRKALREPSSMFHHTLKANGQHAVEKWGNQTYTLSTNSLGFKDRHPRQVSLSSPKYRLLFLGDSFTEGVGYPYEKTFVGLVDAELKDQDVEVLNAAVASYSPAIYWKKTEYLIETLGLEIDHVVVFLDLSDILDEKEDYRIHKGRVVWVGERNAVIKDWIFEYAGLLKNLWILGENIQKRISPTPGSDRAAEEIRYGLNHARSVWTTNEEAYAAYGEEGLKNAGEHLDQLYKLLTKHHIEMTLAVYPWPDQIFHHQLNSLQVTFWDEWARIHSIRFFNFFPDFINMPKEAKDTIATYFMKGDVHWNEVGHQFMGQQFLVKFQEAFPNFP